MNKKYLLSISACLRSTRWGLCTVHASWCLSACTVLDWQSGFGFSSDSLKLTHPPVFCAETQETRGGKELHPVTDTVGAVRLGNDLKENHRLITDTARLKCKSPHIDFFTLLSRLARGRKRTLRSGPLSLRLNLQVTSANRESMLPSALNRVVCVWRFTFLCVLF